MDRPQLGGSKLNWEKDFLRTVMTATYDWVYFLFVAFVIHIIKKQEGGLGGWGAPTFHVITPPLRTQVVFQCFNSANHCSVLFEDLSQDVKMWVYSLTKNLINIYYVPNTLLGLGNIAKEKKTDHKNKRINKQKCLMEFTFQSGLLLLVFRSRF